MRAIGDLQLNGENCWLGLFINSIHNKTYHYLLSSCTKSLQLINPSWVARSYESGHDATRVP